MQKANAAASAEDTAGINADDDEEASGHFKQADAYRSQADKLGQLRDQLDIRYHHLDQVTGPSVGPGYSVGEKYRAWEDFNRGVEAIKSSGLLSIGLAAGMFANALRGKSVANEDQADIAQAAAAANSLMEVGIAGVGIARSKAAIGKTDAQYVADDAQTDSPRPNTVSTFGVGTNLFEGRAGENNPLHPKVQALVNEAAAAGMRSRGHGCCGELHAISRALHLDVEPAGGEADAALVRTPTNGNHGLVISACTTCKYVMDRMGIKSQ
jgi:hypothetical protein